MWRLYITFVKKNWRQSLPIIVDVIQSGEKQKYISPSLNERHLVPEQPFGSSNWNVMWRIVLFLLIWIRVNACLEYTCVFYILIVFDKAQIVQMRYILQ